MRDAQGEVQGIFIDTAIDLVRKHTPQFTQETVMKWHAHPDLIFLT